MDINMTLIIINTLTTLIEVLLATVLMDSFFAFRFSQKTVKCFAIVGAALLLYGLNLASLSYPLKTPLEIILIILLLLFYQGSLRNRFIFCVAWSTILSLSSIVSSIIISALPDNIPIVANIPLFLTTLKSILPKFFLMIFVFLLSAFVKDKKSKIDLKYWMLILSVPLITIAVMTVFQYYIGSMPPEARQFSSSTTFTIDGIEYAMPGLSVYGYMMAAVVGLLFINILVFILFARLQKNLDVQNRYDLLCQQTKMQSRSVEKLETSYMRMRELRHDMQNQLLIMNSLLENEKYDDLKSYVKSMINTVDEAAFMTISGQSAVDAILNEKLLAAHKNKIATNFEIANLQNIFAKPMDLCIILANALDNAVEACVKMPEDKDRFINLKITQTDDYIVVSCSNPTAEEPKKQNNDYISTKSDKSNHGFGLKSIKTTADQYNGEYMVRCQDHIFTLIVKLNRPKI